MEKPIENDCSQAEEDGEDLHSLIGGHSDNRNEVVEVSPKGRFFRFNDELGSGAFKVVYRGLDNDNGCEVAWNTISLKNLPESDRVHIAEEVKLNRRLNHPNIVHFIAAWTNPNKEELVLITELITGGSLKQYLKKIRHPRLKVIKHWCKGILQGLQYLHSQKIIHRDLKCDNIFIMSNTGDVKIGDFGLSTIMRNQLQTSVLGTPEYMAPEIYEGSYDTKVDVFSFGMCVLEMCTLSPPYRECQSQAAIYKKVLNRLLPDSIQTIQNEDVRNFICLCLELAETRPNVDDLLKHEFLIIDEKDPNNHQPVPLISLSDVSPNSLSMVSSPKSSENAQIESSLIIKDNLGILRQVSFTFDFASDTPEKVAEEMVQELDLDPALVIPIANEIEVLVFSSKSYKQISVTSDPRTEELIDITPAPEQNSQMQIKVPTNFFNDHCAYSTKTLNRSNSTISETKMVELNIEDLVINEEPSLEYYKREPSQENGNGEDEFSEADIVSLRRGSPQNNRKVVKQLQRALGEVLKTHVKVDGFFGKKVESLIKEFQETHGIEPDGLISSDLWNCLMIEFNRSKEGSLGEIIIPTE